jgi:MtrB/PioB family decaheme-associated outer membrane protein
MERRLLLACLFGLFFASYSYAENNLFSGGIFLGGDALSLDHQSAKFNEYNALAPGLVGGGTVSYDSGKYHFDADAAYLGATDMYVKAKGGKWGSFKYSFFYTEFPHNYSFEDRTIYVNPGSQTLTLPGRGSATPTNSALWPSTSFDYGIRRKDVGGSLDVTAISPFFVNVTADRLQRQGDMPWSGHDAYSFGKTVELPLPIDDHTTNANVLVGWKNKQFYSALGGGFSEYGNQAEFTRFQDPFTTGATQAYGTIVGPPDNRSWTLNYNGTAKLPLSSVFALNAGFQNNTSRTTLLSTIETGTAAAPTVTTLRLSQPTFNGSVDYFNVGANLTSNPVKDLTTKFYFKYLDRRDNSDVVTFTNPSSPASGSVTNALFSYNKTSVGFDATYRFLKNLKGIIGYDFTDTRREGAEDFLTSPGSALGIDNVLRTVDNTFRAQMVYNPFDWLGTRLKYQKLYRGTDTELQPGTAYVEANNVSRFDVGKLNQDMFKLTADISPAETLNVSFEYAYKLDNYNTTVLGLTKAQENEFILDGNYVWKGMKFFAFFDYDVSLYEQTERQGGGNPAAAPTATAFNWNCNQHNNNYAYGAGTSFPIIKDKLAFIVQYDFELNNGTANFTSQSFTASNTALGINNSNINIPQWDDYTRQNISARLTYDYDKNLGFVFGFLYSQFRLNDGQLNGYQYVAPGPSYLTGAYTDGSYKANVYYVRAVYRF